MNEMHTAVIVGYGRKHAEPAPLARPPYAEAQSAALPGVRIALYDSLEAVEPLWREFEQEADCTAFQTFDYLAAWQTHVGARTRTMPAVVVLQHGRDDNLALFPLALSANGRLRRLSWLGQDSCDYLCPLLAPGFAQLVKPARFSALWQEVLELMQADARFRHDLVDLRKMPEVVGAQRNPFLALPVMRHATNAHLATLSGDWEHFYSAKRSAATRRRDRTKRKRLAESGEVRMVTPSQNSEIVRTVETLIRQKSRALGRMGAADLFAQPGVREFFLELATGSRHLVHVSRLEVGPTLAAINLGLQFRDRYYYVLASYDDGELSRFGPGAAHLRDLMQRAVELGFHEFDFTIGDERYKFEWSDTETRLYDHVAAATARGRPTAALVRAALRLKRTIKQNPALWNAFFRLRSAAASLRRSPRQ